MSSSSQAQAQMPLKDRIAALQQKPNQASSHPSAAPARSSTLSSTGQSTTPPKGTLRDKINKFERKGGVPVPRGSFGMGAPPVTDTGSTKSRELYGNRITSVDRKPGADPLQNGSRSTTAPSAFNRSITPGIDGLPTERLPLSPDVTGESTPDLSALKPRRRLSVVEAIDQYNDLDGVPVSVRSSRRSSQILSPPSAAAALPGVDPDVAVDGGESQPLSSLPTPPPSATTESPQPQMLAKLTPPLKPPMKRAESSTSTTSTSPDVPQTPYSVMSANHAEILSGVRTAITPANSKPTPVVLAHTKSSSSTTTAGGKTPTATSPAPPVKAVPAPIDVPTSPVSEPSLTPVPVTTKSYKVVVHRQPTEQNNTDQNSQDGHTLSHIRSKRHFKHLSANPDPPSPGGAAELSDLLKDAAWFEETLGASFDIPSVTLDSVPAVAPAPTARPSPAGPISSSASAPSLSMPSSLTASSLLSTPPSSRSQTSLSAASTSTAQEIPPTPPPKSARTRRFFSLRSRSASGRTSMSSEMSSDDSVPVATPPSPPSEGPVETLSMRSAKSGVSASTSGSFRLSPHRGITRAATFAERMLGRASKTRSMVDELPTAIPEQTFKLPSPVPERSFDISLSSDSGSPAGVSFDFDAFPSVPQDAPSRTDSSRR